MNFNQNEKLSQVTESTLVIGVDIAQSTHWARCFNWRGVELGKAFKFENSKEGFAIFNKWVSDLKDCNNKTAVIVGAEPAGHYWLNFASYLKEINAAKKESGEKSGNIKLVLVNPYHVKKSKEFDDNNQSKTDYKDPKIIAKLVCEGRYNEPYIPESIYADLRNIMECRRRISKELNQLKNRIQRWIAIYFPEFKKAYCKIDTASGLMALENAPLPQDIIALGADGINQLWRVAKLKGVGIKKATSLYEAALNSVGCKDGIHGARFEIKMLLTDFRAKKEQHDEVMAEVGNLVLQIPNADKLLSIQGVGIATVAGFISEIGDIRRFNSPKQIQKLAGLALCYNSSGKHQGRTTVSKRGRARLRLVLFQGILPLVAKNKDFTEIHSYYTARARNPLKPKQSLTALSCKLIRIFYVILTKGCDYDPVKMTNDIHRPDFKQETKDYVLAA